MKEDFCFIGFVLDRSGSMEAIREATISAFNKFINGLKAVPGMAHLYLVQFDDHYDKLYDDDLKNAPELSAQTFVPRNSTALHDAMGKTIDDIGTRLAALQEDLRPGKVVLVTLTDGLENASRTYSRRQLADMIKHQLEIYKWEFVFLGANQDAIMTGQQLNIPTRSSLTYDSSGKGVESSLSVTSAFLGRFRKSKAPIGFTQEERKKANAN